MMVMSLIATQWVLRDANTARLFNVLPSAAHIGTSRTKPLKLFYYETY